MVVLLPVAWVLVTPFAFAALIAGSPGVNRLVARRLAAFVAVGWAGVAMVVAGAFLVHGPAGWLLLAVGAPLSGLSFWMRSGGGGGQGGHDDDPGPAPKPDEIDWDKFLADLERWRADREKTTRGRRGRRREVINSKER